MTQRLTGGVIPPLMTPFTHDGLVDRAGLKNLIEYQLSAGVVGIFIAGSTGEGSNLTYNQWKSLCEYTVEEVNGRVPVLAGVLASGTNEVLARSLEAKKIGAAFVVATTTYYLRHGGTEHLLHFTKIAEQSPLPVVVYNVPVNTGAQIPRSVVEELSQHENIVGYKDSTGDLETFSYMKDTLHANGLLLYLGTENNNDTAAILGADGTIPGLANLAPEWCCQAFELGKSGDFHAAGEFQRKLLRLHEVYYQGFGSHASSAYSCVKEALYQMGLCESVVTPPIPQLAEENKQRVHDILLDVGLLS